MPIKYKVVSCSNPAGAEGTDYACDRAYAPETLSFKDVAEEMQYATTFTKADVVATLTALVEYTKRALLRGQHARWGDFGIFSPSLKSRCFPQSAIAADDFDPASYIECVRIGFLPGAALKKDLLIKQKFQRVPSDLMA